MLFNQIYCFDEAHYFIEDSIFNINTAFWSKDVITSHRSSISVFLTATPAPLLCFFNYSISEENRKYFYKSLQEYHENIRLTTEGRKERHIFLSGGTSKIELVTILESKDIGPHPMISFI